MPLVRLVPTAEQISMYSALGLTWEKIELVAEAVFSLLRSVLAYLDGALLVCPRADLRLLWVCAFVSHGNAVFSCLVLSTVPLLV